MVGSSADFPGTLLEGSLRALDFDWCCFSVGRAEGDFKGGENKVSAVGSSDAAFEHFGVSDCFEEDGSEGLFLELEFDGIVVLGGIGTGSVDVTMVENGEFL